jgi:hypothetical protein
LNISEPETKVPLAYWSANICKKPSSSIVEREELKRSSIIILKNSGAPKRTAFPDNNGSARSPHRWDEIKAIKRRGTEFANEIEIKLIAFSLLETDNITKTFSYSISDRVPFLV